MWQFFAGFAVGSIALGAAGFVFARRGRQKAAGGVSQQCTQLEELCRLTGEIAHEIKNPLSTIKVNLRLAGEELEDARKEGLGAAAETRLARAQRKIGVIQKEADRVEQILDGFLRYADRNVLQLADVDINEVVSDMVDFYSPQAASHRITMRHSLCGEPLVCRVDADMLKQAILNLFINAQQAMGGSGELMIRTSKGPKEAVLQISDTGPGIPAEKVVRIFEPYHSSRPQGSGLGLPTARRVIDRHGGTIAVDSAEGKGTQFTIKLPLIVE